MKLSDENEKNKSISQIGRELRKRNLCLFVGAGVSKSAGIYDWRGLMTSAAENLQLDVDKEWDDLATLAQYYFDKDNTNKPLMIDELEDKLRGATPSNTHKLICNWPVDNIWTTNYDTLIEDAYKECLPDYNRNVISTDSEITNSTRKWNFNIYKMHGSIDNKSSDIILSSSDYEQYQEKHKSFIHELKSQLMSKTFLFIGFSFNDPNIQYVMNSLNSIVLEKARTHHLFLHDLEQGNDEKDSEYEYRRRKERYRIKRLRKRKIRTTVLKNESELYAVLSECLLRSVKNRVVLCGSDESGKFSDLSEALGYELISENRQLYTCFAEGVGKLAVIGAMRYFGENNTEKPYKELRIWPTNKINQSSTTDKDKYRRVMVTEAGCCIIIGGKQGTLSEYNCAVSVGRLCIPIGYTGGTARKISKIMLDDFDSVGRNYKFDNGQRMEIKKSIEALNKKNCITSTIGYVMNILRIVSS